MTTRGLGSVTFDKTKGKWVARVPVGRRPDGATIYRKRQAETKREAQRARHELIAERNEKAQAPRKEVMFREFAEEHLEYEAPNELRATTLSGYRYVLKKYVYPEYGHRSLASISSNELAKYFSGMRERLSASQVNYTRAVMSRIFDAGINHKFIGENPVRRTKKMRPRQGDKVLVQQHWSLDECRKALEVSRGTRFELFLHLAIYTGMRHGELLALSWDDVDFETATLTVRRTVAEPKGPRGANADSVTLYFNEPKTDRGKRTLTLAPDLISAFRRHRRQQEATMENATDWYGSDCVFTTSNGKPYWPSNFGGYFRQFLKDQGLRHIRVHDIRHSFAVNALELGIDLPSISRALGHSSLQITMDIYGRGAQDLQNRATEGIASYFGQ